MDDADLTQEKLERDFKYLLANSKRPAGPVATGSCLWCEETLNDGRRWCDVDCFSDYNRAELIRKKQGIRPCRTSEILPDSD